MRRFDFFERDGSIISIRRFRPLTTFSYVNHIVYNTKSAVDLSSYNYQTTKFDCYLSKCGGVGGWVRRSIIAPAFSLESSVDLSLSQTNSVER